jgi:hypothetical protein
MNMIGHVGDDSRFDMMSKFREDEFMEEIPKDSQAQISMALNKRSGRRADTQRSRTNGLDASWAFGSGSFSHCLLLYHRSQRFEELPLEIPSNKLLYCEASRLNAGILSRISQDGAATELVLNNEAEPISNCHSSSCT